MLQVNFLRHDKIKRLLELNSLKVMLVYEKLAGPFDCASCDKCNGLFIRELSYKMRQAGLL